MGDYGCASGRRQALFRGKLCFPFRLGLQEHMTPAARIAAAIEILDDIATRRRPASDALKDWGLSHRFAGSGDRAGISGLVFDALRRRASSAWTMGGDGARAVMLGALKRTRNLNVEAISALCNGEGHAPPPLTDDERARLEDGSLDGAPVHIAGDFPEWLTPAFVESYGADAVAQGQALAERAPVDLRANTLKASRDKILSELSHLFPQATPYSPVGLRILPKADGRGPALTAEPAYAKGLVEVQDEGSQLAALLSGATPGVQVLDLCAGAGGKSLALAAMLENQGQVYATDSDGRRLTPIFPRLERSGARNIQVRAPRGAQDVLGDLKGHMDVVFIDAPCTGSGAWRRNPDAKWRIRPGALEQRLGDQRAALDAGASYVKPGGRLIYVTCSVLKAENEDQVEAFLARRPDFLPLDAAQMAVTAGLPEVAERGSKLGAGLRFSPLSTGTDGFYVAGLLCAG
jgi:16S rRNA (cytosine967-C5)-methyltransferase